jgi:flagellar biosynthesis protein FliQ
MPDLAIELGRQAIWTCLLIAAPLLLVSMIVGLVVGVLQAATQIQEQTLSFVPKIIVMVLAISLLLPWLISQMIHYSTDLIGGIPGRF